MDRVSREGGGGGGGGTRIDLVQEIGRLRRFRTDSGRFFRRGDL